MSDITETVTVQDGQAAVKTVAVSGTLSPKKSATDVITVVETPQGKHAAVKVVNIGGGSSGGGGGDFLPTTGGELSGPLGINIESGNFIKFNNKWFIKTYFDDGICIYDGSMYGWYFRDNAIHPAWEGAQTLGKSNFAFSNVFTHKLNNGADIEVPKSGGTLARIEDIDAVVGDISTALTAILGE